jgi:hypothetical protein
MTSQSDNKIILAGTVNIMDRSNFALARYNTTGELDNSSSVDGIATPDFGPYAEDAYFANSEQPESRMFSHPITIYFHV